ncbi:MAG: SUMF1/EgtB/PvdO family nonheme iron enzyme [Phycisphaerae bacterium]|nr:SUMF1/EgtB/PvdO family nonheme iron enzyme [Phycisphaerae bacterium]
MSIKCLKSMVLLMVLTMSFSLWANTAPKVRNVRVSQKTDDSKLVDIYYDLIDEDGDACTVWVAVSDDGGVSWTVPVDNFSGIGPGKTPDSDKHILWDAGKDMPGKRGSFKLRVWADDGKGSESMVVVPAGSFAYQGDYANRVNLEAFMISKYETTNQQYCEFLNAADPDGSNWSSGQEIVRKGDAGNYYYEVKAGRESYPVRYVSKLDADAYAIWKSSVTGLNYRLPTEQEWEKAAGWNPDSQYLFTYAYQSNTITSIYCNYNNAYGGPLPVGSFNGTGGKNDAKSYYGCYDMSGNVWEWTSSSYNSTYLVIRGGNWSSVATGVAVTYRDSYGAPTGRSNSFGFRLVLDL